MYPVSPEFLYALRYSHAVEIKATAYLGGAVVAGAEDLAVVDGSVRVDARSKVRRNLEGLKVTSASGTAAVRDLLTPPGTELQLWRGIRYGNGRTELAPIGRFLVDKVTDDLAAPGAVTITAPDVTQRVIDDKFLTPRAGTVGQTIAGQIASLITETIPSATVTDNSGSAATVPAGIVWERERWDAVEELATAIGCTVYADPTGGFVIDPAPSLGTPAPWTVNAGAGAVLLGGDRTLGRDGVYNVVQATSDPTDGGTPAYGLAQDTNPASPTRVSGPFGRVPRFYSSALLRSNAQAQAAAEAILAKSLGRRSSLSLSVLVNPALEGGDRIDVALPDGTGEQHIADSFTVPLSPSAPMPIETRVTESSE